MADTTAAPAPAAAVAPRRRGRPPRIESFSEWMARLDTEIEAMTRRVYRRPPADRLLTAPQRRIVEMLVEHLRHVPALRDGESPFYRPEYIHVNRILTNLFEARYPEWTKRSSDGKSKAVEAIPNGESEVFDWLLRNCAGQTPTELVLDKTDDD